MIVPTPRQISPGKKEKQMKIKRGRSPNRNLKNDSPVMDGPCSMVAWRSFFSEKENHLRSLSCSDQPLGIKARAVAGAKSLPYLLLGKEAHASPQTK